MEYGVGQAGWDWVGFDAEGARAAIGRAAARVTELLRATTDPAARAHRLEWTIAETAAHLVVVARANAAYARGHTEAILEMDRLPESNRERIDEIVERDLAVLADQVEAAVDDLLDATTGRDATELVPWHGHTIPLGGMYGIVLGELLVHGRDIARAQKARWRIDEADAVHIVRGATGFTPLAVDPEVARARPCTYRVRCRGVPAEVLRFADGALAIEQDAGQRVDCTMRVDPVTYVLVAFGRRSPFVAALQGRAVSWGRHPLAAFRMPSYLRP